jgi:hypothetical protein
MSTPTPRSAATSALAVTAGAALTLLAAPAAGAVTATDYVPPAPEMTIDLLHPVCDGDVPYLEYAVSAVATSSDELTITWLNPGGDDIVQANLPLTGRVLWPGAELGPDGSPVDWPGWRLEDGQWVQGDEFDWVRPSVDVEFAVNPHTVITAAYPPSSPDCSPNPPGEDDPAPTVVPVSNPAEAGPDRSLAETGATVGLYAALAAGLAAVGAAVVLLTRRTRRG